MTLVGSFGVGLVQTKTFRDPPRATHIELEILQERHIIAVQAQSELETISRYLHPPPSSSYGLHQSPEWMIAGSPIKTAERLPLEKNTHKPCLNRRRVIRWPVGSSLQTLQLKYQVINTLQLEKNGKASNHWELFAERLIRYLYQKSSSCDTNSGSLRTATHRQSTTRISRIPIRSACFYPTSGAAYVHTKNRATETDHRCGWPE